MLGSLSFKLRVLAKQVSQDFMQSFSALMAPGNHSFQHRATPTSSIISSFEGGGWRWGSEMGLAGVGWREGEKMQTIVTE